MPQLNGVLVGENKVADIRECSPWDNTVCIPFLRNSSSCLSVRNGLFDFTRHCLECIMVPLNLAKKSRWDKKNHFTQPIIKINKKTWSIKMPLWSIIKNSKIITCLTGTWIISFYIYYYLFLFNIFLFGKMVKWN